MQHQDTSGKDRLSFQLHGYNLWLNHKPGKDLLISNTALIVESNWEEEYYTHHCIALKLSGSQGAEQQLCYGHNQRCNVVHNLTCESYFSHH